MITEFFIALVTGPLIYFFGLYVHHLWELRKYPKGPFPLPIIGNLHLLGNKVGNKAYETLANLAKEYGDVYSISMGMERVVIVNTIEAAREALISKGFHFAGRPSNLYTANLLSRGGKDIAFSDYDKKVIFMKKVAHQSLQMFGDGMERIENLVLEECKSLDERLEEKEGKPIELKYEIGCSVLNIICYMLFGKRYERDDPEFHSVIEFCDLFTTGFINGDPVAFLPWLRFFPLKNLKSLRKSIEIRDPILRKQLLRHKEAFDPNNIKDFTDSLLNLAQDEEKWKANGFDEVTIDHLEMIIFDILVGGSETINTNIQWLSVYLLHWPQYQEEIYQEIQNVIGKDEEVELHHKNQLHLVQATIYETFRFSSVVPLGAPHKALTDSSIAGLPVLKNSQILFNLWAMHNDERHWEEPTVFNPHRWLDANGQFDSKKNESFLPFSAGRRVCLGEVLAKAEIFLFFTRFIRRYKILPDPDKGLPSLEGRIGVTLSPFPFKVVLKSRK